MIDIWYSLVMRQPAREAAAWGEIAWKGTTRELWEPWDWLLEHGSEVY